MPLYEAKCSSCTHAFDYFAFIRECNDVPECPLCHNEKTVKEIRTPAPFKMDHDFSAENKGRGRYIDQLAQANSDGSTYKQNDPDAYCTSQAQALEKCRKRGLTAQKA